MAHAIIDGIIDIPRTKGYVFEKEDAKINADAVSFVLFILCDSLEGGGKKRKKWE